MYARFILLGIFLLGTVARFAQYMHNRALWFDEATLALKVTTHSFLELLNPANQINEVYMVNFQAAPLGFFILVKWLVQILGDHEFVLRLVPQIVGIASLFLFYILAKKYLKDFWAIVICLCIFATSEHLIYFSTEFKPYSVDVVVALSLYAMFIKISEQRLTGRQVGQWAILGAMAIWCSFPSVFVLAGGGLALLINAVPQKKRDQLRPLLLIIGVWALSFLGSYFQYLKPYAYLQSLDTFWQGTYMPLHPFGDHGIEWYGLKWFWHTSIKIFKNPVGLFIPALGTILSLFGVWSLYKKSKLVFLTLVLPVCFTLMASAMHKYPFYGRMILFLCPTLIIFVGSGFEYLKIHIFRKRPLIILALSILILIHPMAKSVFLTVHPVEREEIKQPMEYIENHWEKGDKLYVYFAAEYAFRYYQKRIQIDNSDVMIGMPLIDYTNFERIKNNNHQSELDRLSQNNRVWIIFSHVYDDHEKLFTEYLERSGKQRDVFKMPGASVYLYEFDS